MWCLKAAQVGPHKAQREHHSRHAQGVHVEGEMQAPSQDGKILSELRIHALRHWVTPREDPAK